jgi:Protein of unknown function (DUF3305)
VRTGVAGAPDGRAMKDSERMRVGVVLERRRIDHPWQDHAWRAVSVVPGADPVVTPRLLRQGEGWACYHLATLEIELFSRETEGYRYNLSQVRPVVYLLWRAADTTSEGWPDPFHVTVCPYEAQDYLESGDVVVEGVAMPEAVAHWVADYVARHHVDEPFVKRRRKPHVARDANVPVEEDGFD